MEDLFRLLQASVVIFSILAAAFWLGSATGRSVDFLRFWRPARSVAPHDLPAFQARWNARAASCAAIAALAQGLLYLILNFPTPPH
jgi:hypothetical protein